MQVYGVSVYLDPSVCIIEIRCQAFCLRGYISLPCQFGFSVVFIIDYILYGLDSNNFISLIDHCEGIVKLDITLVAAPTISRREDGLYQPKLFSKGSPSLCSSS